MSHIGQIFVNWPTGAAEAQDLANGAIQKTASTSLL
jgi:hypothetical protein